MDTPYQPERTGFDALDELHRVDWSRLQHAYGEGVVSPGDDLPLEYDVDVLVTDSLAASMPRLSAIQTPRLVALIQAIQSLLLQSNDAHRDAVEAAIDVAVTPPDALWDGRP